MESSTFIEQIRINSELLSMTNAAGIENEWYKLCQGHCSDTPQLCKLVQRDKTQFQGV